MESFIGWIGGKKLLRKDICNRFPDNLNKYVEVFGGAAWVLFYKDKHAEMEVYNDINNNLVNLFRCVKYHPNAIMEELEYMLNSRQLFNDFKELYKNSALTDIQRATMYLYMIKTSFSNNVTTFGAKARYIANTEYLEEIKVRLRAVVIENKSFDKLIVQYDKTDTLFYCDPPYFGSEEFYDFSGYKFDKVQHIKLNEILCNIKGRFIVSYNDNDFIRDLYKGFNIDEVRRSNNMAVRYGKNKIYNELIITNF